MCQFNSELLVAWRMFKWYFNSRRVFCCSTHNNLNPRLQFLNASNWCGKVSVFDVAPKQKIKKSNLSRAQKLRWCSISCNHQSENISSRKSCINEPQCDKAPSCSKVIHGWNSANSGALNSCNKSKLLLAAKFFYCEKTAIYYC